jgi:UDP-N-acetylmuramoyl-tripeptide--D-alanyl-D-alanine ligase
VITLSAGEIAKAVSGQLADVDPGRPVTDVVVDSRAVTPGCLFVAIRGERVDGHAFAADAVAAGALAVLSDRALTDPTGGTIPCIVVDDPVLALGRLASWVRNERLGCTVIAITGSSGKTSTKDLVASVLSRLGRTVSPAGSFNTEVGLPLTVLSADEETRFLVLEMGMRGEGHIDYLTRLARPDVGVVVNVGSAHLGMLGSRDAIARAKGELIAGLTDGAVAVLNGDDLLVAGMADRTTVAVVTFGESPTCDVRATDIRLDDLARPSFTLTDSRTPDALPVALRFSGEHYVSNALAAAAVALALGATLEQVVDGLGAAEPVSRWRMEVDVAPRGFTVINDSYNANPESMRAALKTLAAMAAGRRTWAVLGEMRELGESSVEEHDAVGRLAVRLDISRLVCVGEGTRVMHLGASNEGSWGEESIHVPDVDAAIAHLNAHVRPEDVVLVKASRSVGLERVAEALLGDDGSRA